MNSDQSDPAPKEAPPRGPNPAGKESPPGEAKPAGTDILSRGDKAAADTPAASNGSAADQVGSTNFIHPDGGAAASARLRPMPPDAKKIPLYVRHREKILVAEIILTGIFFLLAMYFLYLWIFTKPEPIAVAPSRAGFVAALGYFPPMQPDGAWKVAATPGRWRTIVIHHTATDSGSPESIDRYHREVNKWENGLGYHFLIGNGYGMGDGQVSPSKRWLEQLDGAHVQVPGKVKGNSYAIGVALVGNFEKRVATPRQLSALRGLLAFLLKEYGLKNSEVVGHGSIARKFTLCPGSLFFLDEVMNTL